MAYIDRIAVDGEDYEVRDAGADARMTDILRAWGWPYDSFGARSGVGAATGVAGQAAIEGAVPAPLRDFMLFGRCAQDGAPAPSCPAAIAVAGSGGSVGISVGAQPDDPDAAVVSVPTPNGLCGIPADGADYYNAVDANGQQWICDAIDLAAGKAVRRLARATLDGTLNWTWISAENCASLSASHVPGAAPNGARLISNLYPRGTSAQVNTMRFNNAASALLIYTNYPDLATFKARLNATPLVMVYALAEPVVADLSDEQLAALRSITAPGGDNVIYTADPAQPMLAAQYYRLLSEIVG